LIFRLLLGVLLCSSMAATHADADSEAVVRQFLNRMITNATKQELDRNTKNELKQFIAKSALKQKGIDGNTADIDTFMFDHFDITGSYGPYVEARVHDWVCATSPTCPFPYYTIRLKVAKEHGHYKVIPSNYFDNKYIQWHWVQIRNYYENQAEIQVQVNTNNPSKERNIAFVKEFFGLLVKGEFEKKLTAEKLKYIDREIFQNLNISPDKVDIPQYAWKSFEIVDAYGHYVDVSVDISGCIKAGNCFGKQVYRIKVKDVDNKLSIVPSGLNRRLMNIEYWWSSIEGHYDRPNELAKYFR